MPNSDTEWLRGWKKLATYANRSMATVRTWSENGLPSTRDGNVYLFDPVEVDRWMAQLPSSDQDDDALLSNASPNQRQQLLAARIRKTEAEAAKIERDNELAKGNLLHKDEIGQLIMEALMVQKRELESMEVRLSPVSYTHLTLPTIYSV